MNEAETRQKIIDERLKKAGWNVDDPSRVTTELDIWTGSGNRTRDVRNPYRGHLFADYALLGRDGYPIAVVEAKKTAVDPRVGKEQARNYAEKIQQATGREMPFVLYTNGYDIHFWDTEQYPPRKIYGFPTREDFERIKFLRGNHKPLSLELINQNIAGRPYQIQAIRAVLESIEKKRRKFLLVMATGTGKTRVCIGLLDVLMRAAWAQRILFLVDRIALQEQALNAFKEYMPNSPRWPDPEDYEFKSDRRVFVCTYPTMLNMIENDASYFSPHFFDIIVADESHRSIYNVYKNIFDYFDALQLGLTATPKDQIDHNTFKLFECDLGLPTFAYSYEEAVNNIPRYLNPFEVLKVRSKFQQQGINTKTISLSEQKRMIACGEDPTELNFEGTDLERKVTNKGTNVLIVRQFMEECIKDPNGVLPGKTIIFAITKAHAERLCDVFNALYPEYKGKLAEVIVSEKKGVHGKGGLLDRFKTKDMPRVGISVDMLDTGIDIREVVNLVLAKPIFSYTKFWQVIGRGTRVLDPTKIKPWCPEKDKFLILDCWENFEYFGEKYREPQEKPLEALPVRLFQARLNKLLAAKALDKTEIMEKVKGQLRQDINRLPKNSVIVLDSKAELDQAVDDNFWIKLTNKKIEFLRNQIAPIMRAQSGVDFKAMHFELDITELATAHLSGNKAKFDTLKEGVIEQISELPLSVNIVARQRELIERAQHPAFWAKFTDDDLDLLVEKLSPLMKYRQSEREKIKELDIQDLLTVKEYVVFGPEKERMATAKYREQMEELIHELVDTNLTLQKLKSGQSMTDVEIHALAELLERQHPHITEDILRQVYDHKKAKFIQFLKHILDLEPLTTFTETVSNAFDDFIARHNTYSERQIQFLFTLRTFILQTGEIHKNDLIRAPFNQHHPHGIRGVFQPSEIDEILDFAYRLVA